LPRSWGSSRFAAQLGLIALSPVLVEVAGDFGVSTAAAGQLRTVGGLAAGFTALALPIATRRLGLRRLLVSGAVILGIGSLASAAAPTFALLAAAQVPVGVGVAVLVATAAAAGSGCCSSSRARRSCRVDAPRSESPSPRTVDVVMT
jgi:predicted MFS family arabinose efflux permease